MKPVPELDWIARDLAVWHGFDPAIRCECSSTAILAKEGWVIFDPVPLSADAREELLHVANVHAIALTSGNHQRDSLTLKNAVSSSLHAPEAARGEIDADCWLKNGGVLAGFSLLELPGAAPGEAAWCDGRHLVLGDAVLHLDDRLELLPDKYCHHPAQLRKSLRQLLGLEFHSVFFAHGLPLLAQSREKLTALLASL